MTTITMINHNHQAIADPFAHPAVRVRLLLAILYPAATGLIDLSFAESSLTGPGGRWAPPPNSVGGAVRPFAASQTRPTVTAVPADRPTIVATSIGFQSRGRDRFDWDAGPIFDLCAELSGATGTPKVCYLGTATGDDAALITSVYSALSGRFRPSHVEVFSMPNLDDVRGHLLAQDVIWVGGGSVANLLALWRLHSYDEFLREAWEAGVVVGGVSAGSLCWHLGGTTDSFGPALRPVTNGLGFLPYSNGVHYDSEEQRRPLYHRLVADGTLADGYATDDGVGLVYAGTDLVEAVADRADCHAYRVFRDSDGQAAEEVIEPRRL